MGLAALGSNLLSSVTGYTEKAILCVKKAETPPPSIATALTGGKLTPAQLQEKLVGSSSGLFSAIFGSPKTTAENAGYHVLEVKYNPSKIKIKSKNGDFMEAGIGGEGTNGITMIQSPNRTTMTVELVFDDVNNQDAFMFEKFTNVSPGAIVSDVAGVVNAFMNKPYTVQPQVDALVATVLQSETKQAVFYWSDMAFAGHIVGVDAKYTMFSPSGHPVRATVQLKIRQIGSDTVENKYWEDAYQKLFKGESLLDKAANLAGNVLNLK